jgi:hypothetical protein
VAVSPVAVFPVAGRLAPQAAVIPASAATPKYSAAAFASPARRLPATVSGSSLAQPRAGLTGLIKFCR